MITKDIAGNVIPIANAKSVSWYKTSTSSGLTLYSANGVIRLEWQTGGVNYSGFLVVRRRGTPVSWIPTNGLTYNEQNLDTNHILVANVTGNTLVNDATVSNGEFYHYQVFGYDATYIYSPISSGSATASSSTNLCSILVAPSKSSLCADPTNKSASQNFAGGAGTVARLIRYLHCWTTGQRPQLCG